MSMYHDLGYTPRADPLTEPEKYGKGVNHDNLSKPLKESFRWLSPEFMTQDAGKNSIKIKGIALKSDTLSRNNRKYVDAELMKSARTFIGKPVTVNHRDPTYKANIVGNVDWAEYEDGQLEYLATVKKQPYVDLLRNRSTNIKGVSIEAIYLKNVCPQCGEKFDTEHDFRAHMKDEHFMDVSENVVHGMVGTALSLVLAPEEVGVPDATLEIMESANRIFEMMITEKTGQPPEEEEEANLEENEEEEEKADMIKELETPKGTNPEADKAETTKTLSCPLGSAWNPLTKKCEQIQDILPKLSEIFNEATKQEMRSIYLSILDLADHNVRETNKNLRGETGMLKAVEALSNLLNHVQEVCLQAIETKQLKLAETRRDTADIKSIKEKVETLEHNFSHMLRGNFRGQPPDRNRKDEEYAQGDPLAEKR